MPVSVTVTITKSIRTCKPCCQVNQGTVDIREEDLPPPNLLQSAVRPSLHGDGFYRTAWGRDPFSFKKTLEGNPAMAADTTPGRIYQINVSRGGVPKLPITQALVTTLGISGDYQRDQRNHGGPDRALCVYTLEQIQRLQREGHPITPGSTGENITLAGISLLELIPGTFLALGDEVEVELTSYAIPCNTITDSFNDGDFTRISDKLHPGQSRIYARVLRAGRIVTGDSARIILPADARRSS
jgi:MOSC domain-containing protein YiiM